MTIHGLTLIPGNYYHFVHNGNENWFMQYSHFKDPYVEVFSCADTNKDGSIKHKWKIPTTWGMPKSITSIRLATHEETLWYTKAMGLESPITINDSYSVF